MSIIPEKLERKQKRDKRKERKSQRRGRNNGREAAGVRKKKTKQMQIQHLKSSLPQAVSWGSCPTGLGVRRSHSEPSSAGHWF